MFRAILKVIVDLFIPTFPEGVCEFLGFLANRYIPQLAVYVITPAIVSYFHLNEDSDYGTIFVINILISSLARTLLDLAVLKIRSPEQFGKDFSKQVGRKIGKFTVEESMGQLFDLASFITSWIM